MASIKEILFPTDLSPAADQAFPRLTDPVLTAAIRAGSSASAARMRRSPWASTSYVRTTFG